jgi:hypothetical protein
MLFTNSFMYFLLKACDAGNGTCDWTWAKSLIKDQITKLETKQETIAELQAQATATPPNNGDMDL